MLLDVERSVTKETYEMGVALAQLVSVIKEALADGWQPGKDVPVIISSMIANLGQVVQGVQMAKEEMAAYPHEFYTALALAMADLAKVIKE